MTRRSDIVVVEEEASGQRKPGFLIIVRPTVKTLPDDTPTGDDGFIFVVRVIQTVTRLILGHSSQKKKSNLIFFFRSQAFMRKGSLGVTFFLCMSVCLGNSIGNARDGWGWAEMTRDGREWLERWSVSHTRTHPHPLLKTAVFSEFF